MPFLFLVFTFDFAVDCCFFQCEFVGRDVSCLIEIWSCCLSCVCIIWGMNPYIFSKLLILSLIWFTSVRRIFLIALLPWSSSLTWTWRRLWYLFNDFQLSSFSNVLSYFSERADFSFHAFFGMFGGCNVLGELHLMLLPMISL